MHTGVIILAAGKSERMGFPKFSAEYDKNHTFLEKIVENYFNFGLKEIIIVINSENETKIEKSTFNNKNVTFAQNNYPDRGRFFSIICGIQASKDSEYLYIHNSDNPYAENDILNLLRNNLEKNSYAVPFFEQKGGHPILLSHEIVEKIKNETNYDKNFKNYLEEFKKIILPVRSIKILTNINTPEEYRNFRKNLKQK